VRPGVGDEIYSNRPYRAGRGEPARSLAHNAARNQFALDYDRQRGRRGLIAGLTVAAIALPQGMRMH
jgi:hypothetical protein